jgi:hypothetical protein
MAVDGCPIDGCRKLVSFPGKHSFFVKRFLDSQDIARSCVHSAWILLHKESNILRNVTFFQDHVLLEAYNNDSVVCRRRLLDQMDWGPVGEG